MIARMIALPLTILARVVIGGLGLALMIAGLAVSLTIIGAVVGLPVALVGLLMVLKAIFG